MNIIRLSDSDYAKRLSRLTADSSLLDKTIEERTRAIIDAIASRRDVALLELTERFDGAKLTAEQLMVTRAELLAASLKTDTALRTAVALAHKNIKRFCLKSLRKDWSTRNAQGAVVGEKFDPFHRVGIYIPGGKAPLVSTALMTIGLAKVAGCAEIVVCTPCNARGEIDPALLFAMRAAGASEIYRVGGAQAIAAMALGTETIRRVQKIFGPGNAYVVAAKRLLFGHAAMDLLPGPSELLILADDTANARFIAADLLAQAEHGSGHERVWLVTNCLRLLQAVDRELDEQLHLLSRQDLIRTVLDNNAALIQARSLEHGIALANQLAPEHCEIVTRQPGRVATGIVTAGAVFLGSFSPTVLGDYVAGPSHTLPTGGAGASFAGLTVDQFQRRTSVVQYDRSALAKSLGAVLTFARVEGLDAHGRSAVVRLEPDKSRARRRKGRPEPARRANGRS